jgi:hypothetical protein
MVYLACTMLVPGLLKSREEGRQYLEALLKWFPRHVPSRYGEFEPLRKRFKATDLDLMVEEWGRTSFIAQIDRIQGCICASISPWSRFRAHITPA